AKKYDEARPIAAEIWFYLGLAYYSKANDELHNSNKNDYEKYINEAKAAYGKSWDYSNNMLESLYNLARGKALTNDEAGAIQDLKKVILKDHGYCIKISTDSDFNNTLKDKLFSQLKRELYPKIKTSFDNIKNLQAEFQSPYSYKLTDLINEHLPKTLTEDMPPFDMLEATIYFLEIISVLKSEQNAYRAKCEEQERKARDDRIERERREREDRIERERKEEQERKDREARERWRIEEEIKKAKKRRYKIFRIFAPIIIFGLSVIFFGLFSPGA
ncbi:TPR end-of-group domain-containing protein, partial [Treponema sp. R80B11-R83G3]